MNTQAFTNTYGLVYKNVNLYKKKKPPMLGVEVQKKLYAPQKKVNKLDLDMSVLPVKTSKVKESLFSHMTSGNGKRKYRKVKFDK